MRCVLGIEIENALDIFPKINDEKWECNMITVM